MGKNIVYSTNPNWKKEKPTEKVNEKPEEQTVILRRERKGRSGKVVTILAGLKGNLRPLQKELQKYCGTGGTSKNGQIELQGEQRKKAAEFLRHKELKVKISGG